MDMDTINLPNPIHSKLDELHTAQTDREVLQWCGHAIIELIFYSYLFRKYKQPCIAVPQIGATLYLYASTEDNHNENYIQSNNVYIKRICHCIQKDVPILIIPVRLYYQGVHANVLIYRRINKTIEIFEPHGKYHHYLEENSELFDEAYHSIITNINANLSESYQVTLISNERVCPRGDGLQEADQASFKRLSREPGYCAAWCMFFTELVLMNPTKTSEELMSDIFRRLKDIKTPSDYLLDVIRGYVYEIKFVLQKTIKIIIGFDMPYDQIIRVITTKTIKTEEQERLFDSLYDNVINIFKIYEKMHEPNVDKEKTLKDLYRKNPEDFEKYVQLHSVSPTTKNAATFKSISPNISEEIKLPNPIHSKLDDLLKEPPLKDYSLKEPPLPNYLPNHLFTKTTAKKNPYIASRRTTRTKKRVTTTARKKRRVTATAKKRRRVTAIKRRKRVPRATRRKRRK